MPEAKLVFALFLVVLLAFAGYHWTFRRVRLPFLAGRFYLTGTEFLFLGLLLGPFVLNVLDTETRSGLSPVIALLLGWVGLLYGFQFEFAAIRRFPPEYRAAAHLEGLVTPVCVFTAAYAGAPLLPVPEEMRAAAALTLASVSACTAQSGLALIPLPGAAQRSPVVQLLRYVASFSGFHTLLFLFLAYLFRPFSSGEAPFPTWLRLEGMAKGVGAGFVLFFLFLVLLGKRRSDKELTLLVIGMAVLTSGIASMLAFSPLLANFLLGVGLVNFSREKERIYGVLEAMEKPGYLLLMLFLGTSWHLQWAWLLPAAGYWAARAGGKLLAGCLIPAAIPRLSAFPKTLGLGLLGQGGLGLAVLLDFLEGFPRPAGSGLVSVVLLATVWNEVVTSRLLGRLAREQRK